MSTINLNNMTNMNSLIQIQTNIYDDTKIQYSINSGQNWIDIEKFPITILSHTYTTVELLSNLTISNNITNSNSGSDVYFIIGSNNITFDGCGNTVFIKDIQNYLGFIQNGTQNQLSNLNILIQNLGIKASESSSLYSDNICIGAGWLAQSFFGNGNGNGSNDKFSNKITQCYSNGQINGIGVGGLIGSNYGLGINISNSYTSGIISNGSDGILGLGNSVDSVNTINITNCYVANGSWSDSDAYKNLIKTPQYNLDNATLSSDIQWIQTARQTPYLLSNSNFIYDPIKFGSEYTDYSKITTILLIDRLVTQSDIFFNSVNETVFPIMYSKNSDRLELKNFLSANFTKINRIGIIFDDSNMNSKKFLNSQSFFIQSDLTLTQSSDNSLPYSSNVQFIYWMITNFAVSNIDYMVCNSLKNKNWVEYYKILNKETNVIVGASNDKTGNIAYGGNWILESTGADIELIYWNNGISSYSHTLATSTITSSISLSNADLNDPNLYTWPITISGGFNTVIVTLSENITLYNASNFFIIGGSYVTIDGGSNLVTISGGN